VERAEELALLLAAAGFEPRVADVAAFALRTRVIPLTHAPSGVPIDLVLAGRAKDLEDVRGVLRQQGANLDMDRIRRLLGLLETALDRTDLLPALEAAVNESRGDGTPE
jgi:hypothetical protein